MKNPLFLLHLPFLLFFLAVSAGAHGISEADRQALIAGGNLRYLQLGAVHMLTGYDHLLFLLGVIFYLTGFRDILKFITAFTVGHSLTLILATFLRITADAYLVDAVIALSVCYKAFDNLDGFRKYLKTNPPPLLPMIFLFGLIHGFGLSTRLQQLPLPEEGLLARILSFNLGVELGQVAALAVFVALIRGWRRSDSFRRFGTLANILLLAAGLGLFAFQITHYLRGDGRHEKEHLHGADPHGPATGSQDHGAGPHSHEADSHDHGAGSHSHEADSHHHGGDSGAKRDSLKTEALPGHGHGHSHGHDHPHGHGHSH